MVAGVKPPGKWLAQLTKRAARARIPACMLLEWVAERFFEAREAANAV